MIKHVSGSVGGQPLLNKGFSVDVLYALAQRSQMAFEQHVQPVFERCKTMTTRCSSLKVLLLGQGPGLHIAHLFITEAQHCRRNITGG